MNIVILDAYTANPGDLDWKGLESLGHLTVHDRTKPDDRLARCQGAEVVLTNKVVMDKDLLDALPDLKYIGVLATGTNIVDLEAAKERSVIVTNVPSYSTQSVAQMVFSHILNLSQGVGLHAEAVSAGDWSRSEDFCFWRSPQMELCGKTLGIFGLGQTGKAVAQLGKAFGMEVIAFNRNPKNMEGVKEVSQNELFSRSDIVSLHCPLTESTQGIINQEKLALMKSTAFLINTGRGPLVVEEDLAKALNEGAIAGAGLDVLSTEPCSADNPLPKARNCFITPHIAWATLEARERLIKIATDNLGQFLSGNPIHVVNP